MYGKKQRIISFLMAFLLIFTFAFINPLTIQKSYGFAFAPVLTQGVARIITGVIASSGFVLHEIATNTDEYEKAIINMSNAVYQSLNNIQKLTLFNLTLLDNFLDNIVEVPKSLYDSIVDTFKVQQLKEYPETAVQNGYSQKYGTLTSTDDTLPEIILPSVYYSYGGSVVDSTTKVYDFDGFQPFFIYEGIDNASENIWYEEGIVHYYNNVFGDNPVQTYEGMAEGTVFLTPDLTSYGLKVTSTGRVLTSDCLTYDDNYLYYYQMSANNTGRLSLIRLPRDININDCIIKSYFVFGDGKTIYSITDIYNKETGEFLRQIGRQLYNPTGNADINNYGSLKAVYYGNVNPTDYTYTYEQETVISPTIPNLDSSANVITLPSELTGTIGLTSQDVNVPIATEPDTPNTETMENINTNVGELVTGGTLGEQVNKNIGTVEGLHGEITEQVDFGAVFDTISQYISALDISSVTWFPTAVASFLVPFLPVISLGMILFFIDRVLNGGA